MCFSCFAHLPLLWGLHLNYSETKLLTLSLDTIEEHSIVLSCLIYTYINLHRKIAMVKVVHYWASRAVGGVVLFTRHT